MATLYDIIYQQKDYIKESNFIIKIISLKKQEATKILDVGCGTGEHLNILKDKFEILHGIDLNKEIIEVAKNKSSKIYYTIAGMSDFKLNMKFDVITSLYSVFNYNLSIEEANTTLINFKNHLEDNGIIIIALYKPTNYNKEISINTGKKDGIEVAKINQFVTNKKTNIETSNYIVLTKINGKIDFSIENDHKMRIYQIDEFRELLKSNNFDDIIVYDNFTDSFATEDTKYPIFVARNN